MADNIQTTNKLITTLNRLQFVGEFFIFSKTSENSHIIPEFLTLIEAIKFYMKSVAIAQSHGIYMENVQPSKQPIQPINALQEQKATTDQQLDRQKQLLNLIKKKPYQSIDYYPQMFEQLSSGKKMQLITTKKIPRQLTRNKLNIMQLIGELLTVFRPLISIISIRIYGFKSYKSYLISLLIDLAIVLIFQKGIKVKSTEEREQIMSRKKSIIKRYIFRKPFYNLLRKMVILPILAKIIKPERAISNFIVSLFDMQSSISLTL